MRPESRVTPRLLGPVPSLAVFFTLLAATTGPACADDSTAPTTNLSLPDASTTGGAVGSTGGASNGSGGIGQAPASGGSTTSGGQGAGSGGSATGGASSSSGGAPGSGGAVAPDGSVASGGTVGSGGAPVNLPPGSGWLVLENTKIAPVCACNDGFPQLCANSGCSGIFAWSSGAYDTKRNRLIVFGGGHSDYFGNEIYGLSMTSRAMTRLTDPGLPPSSDCAPSIVNGTQPNSRHTYDALLYLEHVDRLFVFGGSKSPCGYLGDDTWTYSFADSTWEPRDPTGPKPNGVPGIVADYDSETKKVLLHDDNALYSYDVDTDAFALLKDNVPIDYHLTGVIDQAHRKLVIVGSGKVYTYDLANGYARADVATTGGDPIVDSGYPGLAYDPSNGGRVVAWNGGDTVYALDLDTAVWTAFTSPNGPGAANGTGTYKRWRLIADGTFALVNGHDQNAYLFRM